MSRLYITKVPAKFLLITLNLRGDVRQADFEKMISAAVDWVRYMPNCYIVRTSRTAQSWYTHIKPQLGPRDQILIAKLDLSERQGWIPKSAWDWIRKYDPKQASGEMTKNV